MSEAVLELELTSNRPDCFSVYGIAREVAAASGARLAPPPTAGPAVLSGAPAEQSIAVEVADPDLCPRYGARVIRGLQVGDSPAWLKARLTHAGMRPINNVVDVTNYVMLGWGQPLHAFDAAKIEGDTLIARRAKDGEKIVTLDGVERTLDGEMCVIADIAKPLVIAGVFGAVDAEVDDDTRDVVLEAANFSGPSILRTELHTGIRSEASNRFEKGLDANMVPGGLDFASRLFAELCGGEVAPGMLDVRVERPQRGRWRIVRRSATRCWDTRCPPKSKPSSSAGSSALSNAGALADATPSVWTVTPPTFRPDLEREVDLIEEVGRIAGYGRAPATLPRHSTAGGLTPPQEVRRALRRALAACGLDEVITYTFVAPDAAAPLGFPEDDVRLRPVRLSNPMSVEQSVMRTTLLPGLIGALRDNIARLNDPPNLFELGRVYLWDDEVSPAPAHAAEPGVVLPHEPESVAIVLSSPLRPRRGLRALGRRLLHAQRGRRGGPRRSRLQGEFAPLGDAIAAFPYLHPGKSALVRVAGPRGGCPRSASADVAAAFGVEDLELCTSPRSRSTCSRRWRSRMSPLKTSAPTRRPRKTWPSSSAATCPPRPWSPRPARPAASSSATCTSSTSTRATRCRPTSARWRCASSYVRRSAR